MSDLDGFTENTSDLNIAICFLQVYNMDTVNESGWLKVEYHVEFFCIIEQYSVVRRACGTGVSVGKTEENQ